MVKVLDGVDRIRKEDFWEEEKDGKYGGGRKLEEDKQEQWIPACVPGTYCSGYERAKGPGPHSEMRIIVCPQTSQQALATSTGYSCTLAGANPVRPCAQNGFDGTE
ncbi:hypothetical protein CFAM422_002910 [Trichoderma lentiforme]|uniref:Uncharacterized protein n=1 Tax=Trichoderma lentiforme TaxID=1567552 RepID=A0A9P4XIE7_9HYPO|nr:hypothetical protein CFAM422_002910 [Trichoderma lentiforme]